MNSAERKEIFLKYQGQTSPFPYLIDVATAKGVYIYDKQGKAYMDMIAGVAVNNIGHNHPHVIEAIKTQVDKHLHVMVYGEFVQDAQLNLAEALKRILPEKLNCSYIVNSGAEAIEAALKLAKRVSARAELIACEGSYHGSTHGAMSVSANELKKGAYRPLLPMVKFIRLNDLSSLEIISNKTAAVIIETIQGDAGVRKPSQEFLQALRDKCTAMGVQLIFDEIQCGIGRTGKMFAFEHFGIVPDILTLGKALGGGMPIGAFISSYENMQSLTHDPMLGHITTFGGHPVICAAANACLEVLEKENWIAEVAEKGQILEDMLLQNEEVLEIRRVGMMFAIDMISFDRVKLVVDKCLENGLIGFWFLSHPNSFRLSPPISITREEIIKAGEIIYTAIEMTKGEYQNS